MEKTSVKRAVAALFVLLACYAGAGAETIRTDFANLRANPGPSSRVITALPQGTAVDVVSEQGDYSEVRVTRTGLSGWVFRPAQGWRASVQVSGTPEASKEITASVEVANVDPVAVAVAVPVSEPIPDTSAEPKLEPKPEPKPEPPPAPATPTIMDAARALPLATGAWAYPIEGGNAGNIAVKDMYLEMDALDAKVLYLKDPFDRSVFPVKVRDETGVHTGKIAVKGNFTRNFLKKSLLIALSKGEQSDGRSRFALNAMATDPSQSREWLAWDLIHTLSFPAPNTHFTRLHINGEFIGLYLDIEWMDAAMFERLGLGAKGQFYEADGNGYCGDLSPQSVANAETCWSKIAPRDTDYSNLRQLTQALESTPSSEFHNWLDKHFDAQTVIDWLVVNTLTQNGDTYNKNYFIHQAESDGKWRVIPWDYDLAWGRVADPALPFPRMIYNGFFQYTYPPDLGVENPLKRKVFENPALWARYQTRLQQVLEAAPGDASPAAGWYDPLRFRQRLADLAAVSRSTRAQEKYPVPGAETADTLIEALAFFNQWRGHLLKSTLLEKTVFGSPRWVPMPAAPVIPMTEEEVRKRRTQRLDVSASTDLAIRHARIPLVEPILGWVLGVVTLRDADAPVRLTLENAREATPNRLPPGKLAAQCIERTWYVTVKSEAAATLDMEFDYLHEASTRREVPNGLDEAKLQLFWFDGQGWKQPESHANGIANLVAAPNLRLLPDVVHRFVACQ